nr:gustatory receptor 26 [Papilio polytes]
MHNRSNQYGIENVIESVQVLLTLENIFCIFRYVPIKANNVKRLKVCGVIVSTISVLFFMLNVEFFESVGIDFYITTTLAPMLFLLQYVITIIYFCFTRRNSLLHMLKLFTEIDKTLHILTIKDFYLKSSSATMKLTFFFVLFHVLQILSYFYYEANVETIEFILAIAYIERNLEIVLFCRFMYMIKMRLKIINDKISNYLKIGYQSFKKKKSFNVVLHLSKSTENPQIEIRKLACAYVKVGEIMRILNNDFNFQLFMTLVSCFVVIVFSTWGFFYCFWSGKCFVSFLNIFLWTATEIIVICIVSFICENVLLVHKRTLECLDRLVMDYELCAKVRFQAKVFRAVINVWPLRIIVYDIYPIDFNLIINFVGLTTTSLIIVLQISHIL